MASQFSRADALREYLSGAASDGGAQADPNASLGHYRSSTEALSLGIALSSPLAGVTVLYAGGANPIGKGMLAAIDANHLTWQPYGATGPGLPAYFNGTNDIEIVEGILPGQYLRVEGTIPFTAGVCGVALSYLMDNAFGFADVSIANAGSGIDEYRATIVRNESAGTVSAFLRWLKTLGTSQRSGGGWLGVSGAGTISTSGTLADWPQQGWCQVQTSSGAIREVVYYSTRTNGQLTVPSGGRGLLGTTASAGSVSDVVCPVPGIAIAIDTAGVQAGGSSIQTIANANTPPTSVSWHMGLTPLSGLSIGTLLPGRQVGLWMWRQVPAGAVATPQMVTALMNSFNSF